MLKVTNGKQEQPFTLPAELTREELERLYRELKSFLVTLEILLGKEPSIKTRKNGL